MKGLKAAAPLLIRRCSNYKKSNISHSSLPHFLQHSRSLSSSPPTEDDFENQVLVEDKANSRSAILNRPTALNALNTNMGAKLLEFYKAWEKDSNVGFVTLKGSGRAFSAGGDIVNLYHLMNQGKWEACRNFFGTLYTFIYVLGTYLKPHVAILNGITMGGGTGVSIPGTFRLATDKTVFSTPETLTGFHPDAGASFFLSHLPGHLGEYLALTGEMLNGTEMIACGLATHYTNSEKLGLVEHHLGKLVTNDPSIIETSLQQYGDLAYPDKTSVLHRIEMVDKCFSHDTVEEILDALERGAAETNDPWCSSTLRRLKEASPLSLKVALRSIQEGRFQTLDQCLVREYRMSLQGISKQISGDFCEGVRARMVDKDLSPKNVTPR